MIQLIVFALLIWLSYKLYTRTSLGGWINEITKVASKAGDDNANPDSCNSRLLDIHQEKLDILETVSRSIKSRLIRQINLENFSEAQDLLKRLKYTVRRRDELAKNVKAGDKSKPDKQSFSEVIETAKDSLSSDKHDV